MMKFVAALLFLAVVTASAAPPPDPWPKTRAGALARGWTAAFSAGEKEMRAFLTANLTPESLRKRPIDDRLDSIRDLKKRFGTLKFDSVITSNDGELEVVLLDKDGSEHEFTFSVQTAAPYKLLSVSFKDKKHGLFPGLHH